MSKESLKILYMGTPEFSVTILEGLVQAGYNVVQVVTQPDRPMGRGKKLTSPPVKVYAESKGLSLWQPTDLKDTTWVECFRETGADIAIVAAYGRILPAALLESLPLGFVNVHASILPTYRGAAPIQWAVRNGDTESGISLMQMDSGMDTGDILAQKSIMLSDKETTGSLFERMAQLGRELLLEKLPEIAEGNIEAKAQDESKATYAPMFTDEDEEINWMESAKAIAQKLRAYLPDTGNYSYLEGQRLKFFDVEALEDHNKEYSPGQIIHITKKSFRVQTGDGSLEVFEVQPPGKRRMPSHAFLNGNKLEIGAQFGPKNRRDK